MKKYRYLFFAFLLSSVVAQSTPNQKLWYKQPAKEWSAEALPIGNGRMGAMFFGGVNHEVVQFNEQSLWSGDNNWNGAYETGDHGFGSYRNFGEFSIDFNFSGKPENYIRSLDITKGIHATNFEVDGIRYSREAFASHPNQVMVFSYSASSGKSLSGKISLTSAQGAGSVASKNSLSFSAEMPNHLKYAAKLFVSNKGGQIRVEGNRLVFENCNSLTLYLDARTNYKPDYQSDWRGADSMPVIENELALATKLGYKNCSTITFRISPG